MVSKYGGLYEFGEFTLDAGERTLRRGGEPVQLTAKVFDLLLHMVENPARLLTKEDLLKAIWPDSFVEEANLSVNVSTLRKALGETPGQPRYVETVPKQGYRFISPVRRVTEDQAPVETLPPSEPVRQNRVIVPALLSAAVLVAAGLYFWWMRNTSSVADIRSIAVLPFRSLQAGADESLGLGMADAVITRLTNVQQITVRPTSSIQKYSAGAIDPLAAGRELQVQALLDGRIQHTAETIRVTVQLLRVRDGRPLWAATFDDAFTNIFAVQDSISARVAKALSVHLSQSEQRLLVQRQTDDVRAYELLMQGQYLASRRVAADHGRAIELFEQATEEDPHYALAYSEVAASSIHLAGTGTQRQLWDKARAAAKKAVELDPKLAAAHLALGEVYLRADWNWLEARREFDRALAIDPKMAASHAAKSTLLSALGEPDQALREMELAYRFDPASAGNRSDYAWTLYLNRHYDLAIAASKLALQMDPRADVAHRELEKQFLAKGLYEEAEQEYHWVAANSGQTSAGSLVDLAMIYARQGKLAQARAILQQCSGRDHPDVSNYEYEMARLNAALGDLDAAITQLRKASERHLSRAIWMKADPDMDPLRNDPRFQNLLRQVRLE